MLLTLLFSNKFNAMKKILLILFVISTSLMVHAEKKQVSLSTCKWYSDSGNYSSADEFIKSNSDKVAVDPSAFSISNDKVVTLHTIIETQPGSESKIFFEIGNKYSAPKVFIDGKPITNLRQDSCFTSEITNSEEKEELLLTLIIEPSASRPGMILSDYLKEMSISEIKGVTITWCEPMKDPFFGGYMIEVHVFNLLQKDVDGKLKAHITDVKTFELIAENNNCAFTRSNSEAVIDINFPEAKDKLIKGQYQLEIELVDKEKNEEIVDRLLTPVWLE
jgi:hypothetical protein